MLQSSRTEVLLIGGRSGVGKTTVSYEVSEALKRHGVAHALIDGDTLDAVYPPVDGPALAEANLAAIWRNYAELRHDRAVYVNTASVLETEMICRALGGDVSVTGVLLTADDAMVRERLGRREIGSALGIHLERSARAARNLETMASSAVHRVSTDGRSVDDIATSVIALTRWTDADR